MANWQWFALGVMTALMPSMMVLALMLRRVPEVESDEVLTP